MLGVGFPSLLVCLAEGLAFLEAVSERSGAGWVVGTCALFLSGLAGVWGSETLRRKPGHRAGLARLGCALGLAAFAFLLVQVYRGVTA